MKEKLTKMEKLIESGYKSAAFKGFPVAVVFYLGPEKKIAKCATVHIYESREDPPKAQKTWWGNNVFTDQVLLKDIAAFLQKSGVKSLFTSEETIGCTHFNPRKEEKCRICK